MRPELKLLGVGAACAACCAIPVALPAIAGLSLTGLGFSAGGTVIGLVTGAAVLLGLAIVLFRRRAAKVCAPAAGCGCNAARAVPPAANKSRTIPSLTSSSRAID
jgi:hypothetical protein